MRASDAGGDIDLPIGLDVTASPAGSRGGSHVDHWAAVDAGQVDVDLIALHLRGALVVRAANLDPSSLPMVFAAEQTAV